MSNVFFYFICGLFESKDDPAVWSNQAQAWMVASDHCAEGQTGGFTYFDDVAGGLTHDEQQADEIAIDFSDANSDDLDIDAAGHSNAVRILLFLLKRFPKVRIRNLHLIAGAALADCQVNGLNDAIARGQVGRVVFYCSQYDEWLGVGKALGYGDLGKVGPQNMSAELEAKSEIVWKRYKHNDWTGPALTETLTKIATMPTPAGWGQ